MGNFQSMEVGEELTVCTFYISSVSNAEQNFCRLRHINMERNEVFCIPQLKCVEGRVVTHEGNSSKRLGSGRKSARKSKSLQSGSHSARGEAEAMAESLKDGEAAGRKAAAEEGKGSGETEAQPSAMKEQATSEAAEEASGKKDEFNLEGE